MQVTSPQFSNSSKCNLSSLISPTRNKRIVSAEHCCSSLPTNRINSVKKLDSPSKVLDTKARKKSQSGHTKAKSKDFLVEMNNLKEQYMNLKTAYKELATDKVKQNQREGALLEENSKMKTENQKLSRENQNLKGKVTFLQAQIQRIKRESIKLVEIWQFRLKNVEQTLSQKETKLSIYRECLKNHGIDEPRTSTKRHSSSHLIHSQKKIDLYNSLAMNDSLVMTNPNLQNLSNTSEYLSISLNDIQDQSELIQTRNNKLLQVSEQVVNCLSDITRNNCQEVSKKVDNQFKKMRKQLIKKIEVNIDDKHKQAPSQIQPRTPLDRKTTKPSKIPKIKLKKDQDYIDCKSSKKKMSAR